jgi:ubiquinone/menaquinone biosynthesis C-methylase UbiE
MASHSSKTAEQFGKTANAYLSSAVHRQGPDLIVVTAMFGNAAAGATVLDLGCGAGHLSFTIAPHVKQVVAYDLSSEMLKVVEDEAARRHLRNITTTQGHVQELPFPDASFDWICTRYSAHHWLEIDRAIAETRRVLTPGGTLIVIDTYAPAIPLLDTHMQAFELLRDGSHVRNYTFAEWSALLGAQGFQIEAQRFWKIALDFKAWVERMQTPPLHVEALRSLMKMAPQEVRRYFEIAEDGSFQGDSLFIEAKRVGVDRSSAITEG